MNRIGYWLFLTLVGAFSLIPFRLIYLFSDGLALMFFHIIRYRKEMILRNLKSTFPDKSEKEIRQLCFDSYKNLSDILLEAIKGFSLSEKEIRKRYAIEEDEKLDQYFKAGKSVVASTAHLGNWEWGAYSLGIHLKHKILGVYKKVKDPYINQYLIRSRSKFDVMLREMKEVSASLETLEPERPIMVTLIADQRPSDPKKAYWTTFLNRETAFFYGMEKFALQYDLPVAFFGIHRIKRGYYKVKIDWLCEHPSKVETGFIIKAYAKKLESEILKRPGDWLWSHSRWKHDRPRDVILN